MKAEISEGLHRDRHIVVPCGLRIRKAPRSRHEGHDAADKIPVTVSKPIFGMVYYCCFGWSAN